MTIAPQRHRNSLTKPDSRSVRLFTLLGFLILLIWLALSQLLPSNVILATASTTQFSADRAMRSLEIIASQPRPIGSSGHTAARSYLIGQIEALGLQPEVQTTTVVQRWQGSVPPGLRWAGCRTCWCVYRELP